MSKITNENIDDIVCSALEGGITYWCDAARVKDGDFKGAEYASEVISRGGVLLLEVEGEVKVLNRENLIKGIELAADLYKQSVVGFIEDHDAGAADNAVQFAVFGKLIYG